MIYWFLELNSYPKSECKSCMKTEKAYKFFCCLTLLSHHNLPKHCRNCKTSARACWEESLEIFCQTFLFPKFLFHKLLQNTYFLENYPIRALSKWVNEVLSIHLLAKKGDHRPTTISKKVVVVVHRVTLRRSAKKRQLPLNVAYCTSSVVFWYWGW